MDLSSLLALVTAEARLLGRVLSASADHIYMYDAAGRYLYVKRAGAEALGKTPAAIIGRHWRELGFPTDIMERFDELRYVGNEG
ncbi:MAG: PAS domain-containing protein [Syntrophales bacterium]|nr:PAS domain-containing protein [Syntrophales bacterium]